MDIIYYFWSVGIILVVLEVFTPSSFIFFSFGIGCFLSSLFLYFNLKLEIVFILFSLFSMGSFYLLKKFKIFSVKKEYKSNVDSYIGKKVLIKEKISNKEYKVKIFSEEWIAYSEKEYYVGDEAEILRVEGIKLIII